jgi:uncharacterized protein
MSHKVLHTAKVHTSSGRDGGRSSSNDGRRKGTALITGASSGIGAAYADRLAARGYDLILVARNAERLEMLADRLMVRASRSIETLSADLRDRQELSRIEDVLRRRNDITMLVNNAGVGAPKPLLDSDVGQLERMLELNVTTLMRLTYAAVPAFVKRGAGAIVNIASIVGIAPEVLNGVYGGTKAFVLAFSRSLHDEFGAKGIRVQAVLPGATATEFWPLAGTALEQLPTEIVMSVDDMVDAALSGFDQGELVTIPSLPDVADWNAYESARQHLLPKLSRSSPAERYGVAIRP